MVSCWCHEIDQELHKGVEQSPTYAHGRRKQVDVKHFANLRQKFAGMLMSVSFGTAPAGLSLPLVVDCLGV